jgi:O-antigen/teichoic acid export membrane protein
MSATALLARGIVSNWMGYAVQMVTAFVLTPFVLKSIGVEAYGIWSVAVGLAGYYGLLDLGIRSGLAQFIARAHAVGDQEEVNRFVSTGVAALAVIGFAAATATWLLSSRAPLWFGVAPSDAADAEHAVLLLGLVVSIQFVFFPFSAVLTAMQRFDVANGIGIALRLATAMGTVAVLSHGGGLVGLATVSAAGYLSDYVLRALAVYRLMPALRVRPARASMAAVRRVAGFSAWNVVITGGTRLISYSDVLVIGAFAGAAAATPFALAANVVNYFSQMIVPVEVFFPAVARLDAQGDRARLCDLFVGASRFTLALVAITGVAAAVWAADFYRLWLGPRLDPATPVLFRILLAATVFTLWERLGGQILLGMGRVKTVALLVGAEAVANLVLSLWFVRVAGVIGVAFGTLVPAVIFGLVIYPVIVSRVVGMPLSRYYWGAASGPSLAVLTAAAIFVPVRNAVVPVDWRSLVESGIFAVAISSVLLLLAVPDVRRRLVRSAAGGFTSTRQRAVLQHPDAVPDAQS